MLKRKGSGFNRKEKELIEKKSRLARARLFLD